MSVSLFWAGLCIVICFASQTLEDEHIRKYVLLLLLLLLLQDGVGDFGGGDVFAGDAGDDYGGDFGGDDGGGGGDW
jgi:hypothetical protein